MAGFLEDGEPKLHLAAQVACCKDMNYSSFCLWQEYGIQYPTGYVRYEIQLILLAP